MAQTNLMKETSNWSCKDPFSTEPRLWEEGYIINQNDCIYMSSYVLTNRAFWIGMSGSWNTAGLKLFETAGMPPEIFLESFVDNLEKNASN